MNNSPVINVEHVSVTYANGHTAIEDINLSLSGGSICGLVGMNGAGKSTLFKSIMGLVKPNSGHVTIKGLSVRDALKKNIVSYVPQTEDVDWTFPILVEDVVMMGRYGHMGFLRNPKVADKQAVDEALERVDMSAYRKRQIGELSGGQKKRVFGARALAQGAEIILLDEPFTGVDLKTEESLISLFHTLAEEGHLVLVSTHNLGSVPRFCNDVILINKKILAYGPVETTFNQANLVKTFGGMLRQLQLSGTELHDDDDDRGLSVLTDDEHPLVLYGADKDKRIIKSSTGRKSKT